MKEIILPTRALSSILQDQVITTFAGSTVPRFVAVSRHVINNKTRERRGGESCGVH
ncbi:hypothetical protein OS493_009781 [Desmophyllum pertusum]|uniref:Uncharacterized protein n=1 Tax=Desmophyllum pertusum TaxID=174260 RepID=A0A9W9YUC7_9CNID|nr:hypothetical protein OS493_009781 [Desmophyllum pertusum]